eukprot:SAG11_NODE_1132_length_5752_cov_8.739685_4_plen_217_part_00
MYDSNARLGWAKSAAAAYAARVHTTLTPLVCCAHCSFLPWHFCTSSYADHLRTRSTDLRRRSSPVANSGRSQSGTNFYAVRGKEGEGRGVGRAGEGRGERKGGTWGGEGRGRARISSADNPQAFDSFDAIDQRMSRSPPVCPGSFAATTAQSIVFPFDTLRRRLQANGEAGQKRLYSGLLDCVMKTFRRATHTHARPPPASARCCPSAGRGRTVPC